MERFTPYLLCALFLAAMFGLMRLALFFNQRGVRRRILKSGTFTPKTVHALLLADFGENALICGKFFREKNLNIDQYEKLDYILILNGALAAITFCREEKSAKKDGKFASVRIENGEKQLIYEDIEQSGKRKQEILCAALQQAGYKNLPVHHVAVYPAYTGRIPTEAGDVFSPAAALRKLHALDPKKAFPEKQKKKLRRKLEAISRTARQLTTKPKQKRHRR